MNGNSSLSASEIRASYVRPAMRPRKKRVHNLESLVARLLWYTDFNPDGCWYWTGATSKKGYGITWNGDATVLAHRLSHELFIGPIPEGFCVCHKCDVPKCVNPDHFFLGTKEDNVRDMDNKGRRRTIRGEQHPFAKLTESSVLKIYQMSCGGKLQKEIAEMFGVSRYAVNGIVKGKTWKQLSLTNR